MCRNYQNQTPKKTIHIIDHADKCFNSIAVNSLNTILTGVAWNYTWKEWKGVHVMSESEFNWKSIATNFTSVADSREVKWNLGVGISLTKQFRQ